MDKLRIFVSSPDDVAEERVLAERIILRLQDEFSGRVNLETIFWNHPSSKVDEGAGGETFRPSQADIIVSIVWTRLGTPVPTAMTGAGNGLYDSETEYFFENAESSFRKTGRPAFLFYRKRKEVGINIDKGERIVLERLSQKEAVDLFIKKWFEDTDLKKALHTFETPTEMERMLEGHLRELIVDRAPKQTAHWSSLTRPSWTTGSPFRGLDVFEYEHAPIFFGRSRAVSEILDHLRVQAARKKNFLLILGQSGCGKSSLVRAGLLPFLTQPGVIKGVDLWRRAIMRPSDFSWDLLLGLIHCLLQEDALPELGLDGTPPDELTGYIRNNPLSAVTLIKGGLSQAASGLVKTEGLPGRPNVRLILVVDQREEVFSLDDINDDQIAEFFDLLANLVSNGLVWIVCTMDSAFYPRSQDFSELLRLKEGAGQYDLPPVEPEEITGIIRSPALAAGLVYEKDVNAETALRARMVHEIISRLQHQAVEKKSFLLVIGQEACGKSTLIIEEVLPVLIQAGVVEGIELWRTALLDLTEYTGDVFDALSASLLNSEALLELSADGTTPPELAEDLRRNPLGAAPLIKGGLSQAASDHAMQEGLSGQPEARLVLVVDQFEEIFNNKRVDPKEAGNFINALSSLARSGRTWVICVLCSDFFAKCDDFPQLGGLLEGAGLYDFSEVSVEDDQVASLVDELSEAAARLPRSLPLLEFTLNELYRGSPDHTLTYEEYERLGGLEGALDQRAEEVFESLSPAAQKVFPHIFRELVGIAGGNGKTLIARGASLEAVYSTADAKEFVDAFIDAQLFVADHLDDDRVQIRAAHKVLFQAWERLQNWIRRNKENLRSKTEEYEEEPEIVNVPVAAKGKTWPFVRGAAFGALMAFLMIIAISAYALITKPHLMKNLLNKAETVEPASPADKPPVKTTRVVPSNKNGPETSTDTLARINKRLVEAEHLVALAYNDRAVAALQKKTYNEARLLLLNALARFNPSSGGMETAELKGRIISNPDYPVILDLLLQIHLKYGRGSLAYSPDGKVLATGTAGREIRLWDIHTGKEINLLIGHTGPINGLAFSPDNKFLASASDDKTVRLWDTASGEVVSTFEGHTSAVTAVCFSPDGKKLVSGADDGAMILWEDIETGRPTTMRRHAGTITSLAFSPNGRFIASGSDDKSVRLWNAKPARLVRIFQGHTGGVNSIDFSPDGDLLASGSSDRTIRLWSIMSGDEKYTLHGHADGISSVRFSPDGRVLATGSYDQTIRLWDLETKLEKAVLQGYSGSINNLCFGPDGRILASVSDGKVIRLWDLSALNRTRLVKESVEGGAVKVCLSPDGRLLASGSGDKNIRLRDASTGKVMAVFTGHTGAVYDVCFSPDSRLLASGSGDKTIRIWDVMTGKEVKVLEGHAAVIYSVRFSPNGRLLASGSGDKTIRLWDVESGEEKAVLTGHTFAVLSVAFSPARQELASGSSDKTVRIWNVHTGKVKVVLSGKSAGMYGGIKDVSFSSDGALLATAQGSVSSLGGVIRLWDMKSNKIKMVLRGHIDSVTGVRFSPDGSLLASSSGDRTVRLWDVSTGEEAVILRDHSDTVSSLAFSKNGDALTVGLNNGDIMFWNLEPSHVFQTNNIEEVVKEAERAYNLRLVNFDILPAKEQRKTDADKVRNPVWPPSHPFHWVESARKGDTKAMVQLGLLYDRANDNKDALYWYQKASDAGDVRGKERLEFLKK